MRNNYYPSDNSFIYEVTSFREGKKRESLEKGNCEIKSALFREQGYNNER